MARHGTWTETGGGGGWEPLAAGIGVIVLLAVGAKVLASAVAAITAIVMLVFWCLAALAALVVAGATAWVIFRLKAGKPIRPAHRLPVTPAARPRELPRTERPALNRGQGELNVHLHGADAVREWAEQIRRGQ